MKIKSLLVVAIFLAIILCSGGAVKVQAVDNSALIAQIQAQIAQLTAQLQVMLTQQGTASTWCHTFNTNLGFANSGTNEVSQLHTALQKQGISYGTDAVTTYTEETSFAVIQFQARYGITPQSGYVGPLTRAKLNSLYGCNQTTPTTPTVTTCTSFNYSNWSACSSSGVQTRTPTSYYPIGCTGGAPVLYQSCSYNSYCTEGNWTSTLSPSTCPSYGQQTRTWTKIGSCQNGTFHSAAETIICTPASTPVATCTNFSYSDWGACSTSGTQTRSVTASSPSGCTGGSPVYSQSCEPYVFTPEISVIMPNGGEEWQIGKTYDIIWGGFALKPTDVLYLYLTDGVPGHLPYDITPASQPLSISTTRYSWTIPSTVVPGSTYKIGVRAASSTISAEDTSNGYFRIDSQTTTSAAAITSFYATRSLYTSSTWTITWDTRNTSTCQLSWAGIQKVEVVPVYIRGSKSVSVINTNTAFRLYCNGINGATGVSQVIYVNQPQR